MCGLKHPKEAWLCALIIASLPKLKTLELYAAISPNPKTEMIQGSRGKHLFEEPMATGRSAGDALEISRVASALTVTEVEDLTLSTGLYGLHVTGFPSLKTLTVDLSRWDSYPQVPHGSFVNVTMLNIQYTETDGVGHYFATKLNWLISSLLSVRTLNLCVSRLLFAVISLPK
jgi:hypothetical protein